MKCRFCDAEALAIFTLSDGCFCCPDEHEHAYCGQHIIRATPFGTMELKEILRLEAYNAFTAWQLGLN